jgi:hypothetical protein
MNQNDIERILNKLDAHSDILARLEISINGNGTKGLSQRINDIENNLKWVNGYLISISAVGTFLWGIAQFCNNWFQDLFDK